MLQYRECPHCYKSFLPRHIKQVFCTDSHRVRFGQIKRKQRGDIQVVCTFLLDGPDHSYRCILAQGHKEDHLIRVAKG